MAPSTLLRPAWNVLHHCVPSGISVPHTVSQRIYNEHVIVCRGPTPLSFHVSRTDGKMSLSVQLGTSSQSEGATCSASRWRNRTRPVPEILPPMGLTSNSGMRPLPFKLEPKVGSCDTSSFSSSFSPSTWCFWSWWTLCAACSLSLLSALPSDYLTVLSVVAWRSSVQWQCKVSCHGAYCSLWWSWCADVHTAIECVPRNRIAQSQGHSWTALVNVPSDCWLTLPPTGIWDLQLPHGPCQTGCCSSLSHF